MNIIDIHNRNVARQIEHVDNGTTDQAEGVMAVPASAYTDQEQFDREMALIFKKLPIFIGLSHEIPNPGDYKTIDIQGMPLLVVRQKDGSARVMVNVCTHRAMLVATEPYGNKGVFSCVYHGWSFNCDGSLRGVAEAGKFGEVDKSTLGLTQLPTYERGGFIFAVLTPGLEVDFAGFLSGMIEDIEDLNFPAFTFCGTREMKGANWKVAYDGYLEGYHFAAAHPDTIYPRTYSNVMAFDFYGPHVLIGFPQRSIDKLKAVPEQVRHQYENQGFDFVRLVFPNVSIFVAPELTQVAQLLPGPTPDQNRTVVYYLHRENLQGEAREQLEKTIDWIWKVVEEEDYGVGLKVQRGLQAGTLKEVVFGRNEKGNQYFHQWVNYFLKDDPAAPKPTV